MPARETAHVCGKGAVNAMPKEGVIALHKAAWRNVAMVK